MIFKLDDRSEVIEAVANEELLEAHRELLREDELLIVQGKVQLDRFSGGLRLNVAQVWDLAGARARFGRYLAVAVNGMPPPLADVLRALAGAQACTPSRATWTQGLGVRLQLRRADAMAELDLGDAGPLLALRRGAGALAQRGPRRAGEHRLRLIRQALRRPVVRLAPAGQGYIRRPCTRPRSPGWCSAAAARAPPTRWACCAPSRGCAAARPRRRGAAPSA